MRGDRRRPAERAAGFGLMVLVALMAVAGILVTATSLLLSNVMRETQLQIDQIKAYHLAQAGVMRALHNWLISSATEENRRWRALNAAVSGNQRYRAGVQANFAYFTFDLSEDADWQNGGGGTRRLRRFRIRNIHTSIGGTSDEISFARVRVSWEPDGGTTLRRIALNNVNVLPVGSYANGADVALTGGTPAQRRLGPGAVYSGNNTFLEWNAPAPPDPITVTVQWTFTDDSATRDSKSHRVTYWDGDQGGGGRPLRHTFSITSTGQVNQTSAAAFRVMQTVRATVSGTPSGRVEIIDWDRVEKNIP